MSQVILTVITMVFPALFLIQSQNQDLTVKELYKFKKNIERLRYFLDISDLTRSRENRVTVPIQFKPRKSVKATEL